jgi:hypothetical protein
MTSEILVFIKNNLWVLVVFWVAMWFAKSPFHYAVRALSKIIHNAMRLTAASMLKAEQKLSERNREVLMADGLEQAERMLERKFERIGTAVEKDLEKYPPLHRKMSEVIAKMDDDYNKATDFPPSLPDWINIIEGIANIKHSGDSLVTNMLGEIHESLKEQHDQVLADYRDSIRKRHGILSKMLPAWRKVQKCLGRVETSISNLNIRAKGIDRFVEDYEQVRAKTDQAARRVSSSSLTQFFIAGFAMAIAVGGAIINFNLIALPMSEMVGGASHIGAFRTSDVAGMVIILVELSMGLFLMESLRITRLFPIIGSMDDRKRIWMVWCSLTILTILAGVESSLAFMRDRIAADIEALRQTLAGAEMTKQAASKIPMIGQMVMGFVFPFALAFVAIPLESFIKASRSMLGVITVGLLRVSAFLLRLIGNIAYHLGTFIMRVYDLLIFPRLIFEGYMAGKKQGLKGIFSQSPKEDSSQNEEEKMTGAEKGEQNEAKEVVQA